MSRIIAFDENGKMFPARRTVQNLVIPREKLTGVAFTTLIVQVITFVQKEKEVYRRYVIEYLCNRHPSVEEKTVSEFFVDFSLTIKKIIEESSFQADLTALFKERPYYMPRATWVVERREIRKELGNLFKAYFPALIGQKIEQLFRHDLKIAFVLGMEHTLLNMNMLKKDDRLVRLAVIHEIKDDDLSLRQKLRLAVHTELPLSFVQKVLQTLQQFPTPLAYQSSNEENVMFRKTMKTSILSFILKHHCEIIGSEHNLCACSTVITIISEIFAHQDIVLYLQEHHNNPQLLERLYTCLLDGKVQLTTMTCPDYSGQYVKDAAGKKWWVFDFETINTGEGVVAQKAYPLVIALHDIFKKYIPEVSVRHDLPTMEFPVKNGFRNGLISKARTTELLEESLHAIQNRYRTDFNIEVIVGLSKDVISDELFEAKRETLVPVLRQRYLADKTFCAFVDSVLKKRKNMYRKWYPQTETQSDEAYQDYLMDCVFRQIADYCNDVEAYTTSSEHVFMVYSDSPILSAIYAFSGFPALSGQGRYVTGYQE